MTTHTYLTKILSSDKLLKPGRICFGSAFWLLVTVSLLPLTNSAEENRVAAVVQKMESAFKALEDYTCEVEQIFYQGGEESQRYRFKFCFKREKKIRVDFSYPYSTLTIFFKERENTATVLPVRSIRALKFRISVDNPLIHTPAGQRIDQTDMGYFINFLSKNLQAVKQETGEFYEDTDQIRFWLWGLDYIQGRNPEKYRIFVSKQCWFPTRIERYDLDGKPLEVTVIQNYAINTLLSDKLFVP